MPQMRGKSLVTAGTKPMNTSVNDPIDARVQDSQWDRGTKSKKNELKLYHDQLGNRVQQYAAK